MHFHGKILKERNVVSLYHLSNQSAQEKNLSYLFDFRYLKRHIVLWKSSSSLCLLYVICNTKILQSSTSLSIYIFPFLCFIPFFLYLTGLYAFFIVVNKYWSVILDICKCIYCHIEHYLKSSCHHQPNISQFYGIL